MRGAMRLAALVSALAAQQAAALEEVRPGVFFAGEPEPAGGARAAMQGLIFDFATAWADCNTAAAAGAVAEDIRFAYPTTSYQGVDRLIEDIETFCAMASDVSFYFPADAFYIDESVGRIAAEVQFRAFQRGARQVVNDVWIATVRDGRIAILKEYLDGRVKDLQADGVLTLDESPAFLTPWPPRTEAWSACFPVVRAAPVNACPPAD